MIDIGRKMDMEMLAERIGDPSLTRFQRARAYRTLQNIRRMTKDKTILRLRLRLIAANRANDHKEIEKIGERITEYQNKHNINRRYR